MHLQLTYRSKPAQRSHWYRAQEIYPKIEHHITSSNSSIRKHNFTRCFVIVTGEKVHENVN